MTRTLGCGDCLPGDAVMRPGAGSDRTRGAPIRRRNPFSATGLAMLLAVALALGGSAPASAQAAKGFTFLAYGDSRSMMYLP